MGASEKIAERLVPLGESLLEPGEELRGVLVASLVKTFGGGSRAVLVTDRRLLIVPVDRKWQQTGEPLALSASDLASASVDGLSGGWWNTAIALLDDAGFTLRLKTVRGDKLKLMFMGGGSGLLGSAGGGETQANGVKALAAWFAAAS